jgi:hypothetical protein
MEWFCLSAVLLVGFVMLAVLNSAGRYDHDIMGE